jgi:hypothetical protein
MMMCKIDTAYSIIEMYPIEQQSESAEDIVDCDPHLQIWVFPQGQDMFLDVLADWRLLPFLGYLPFRFHAHFSNVGDGLVGSADDQGEGLL